MSAALSVGNPEPVLSKRRLAWAGLAALVGCAAACSLPMLAVVIGGGALAAAVSSVVFPGAEVVVGGLAFAGALGLMALRARARRKRADEIPVIACTPAAVPADKRQRWIEVGVQIYGAVEELQELAEGYACRLPSDAATVQRAAEYVTLDRLCCTFARWELSVEPNGGPLWLRLTGPEGTKELTRSVFETTNLIDERVLRAAGLQPRERRTPAQVVAEPRPGA